MRSDRVYVIPESREPEIVAHSVRRMNEQPISQEKLLIQTKVKKVRIT